jgi:hypothetical protein
MATGLKMIEGDFVINPNGSTPFVTETDKCARDFLKMMLTPSASTPNTTVDDSGIYRYNALFGNDLINIKSFGNMPRDQVLDSVNLLLESAIKNYMDLQDSRLDQSYGELILSIDYDTYYHPDYNNQVLFDITITTAAGTINVGTFSQQVG